MKHRPELALLHPSWLVALALLAVNDHVWKRSGVVPFTGKISDFAGLFVAPALLAAVVRAGSTRALVLCHAAVALGFTLVKTWTPATHLFDALLGVFLPSKTVTDPTDLVALPMGLVAWRVLVPQMLGHQAHVAHRLAMIVGCGLCVATSKAPEPLKLTVKNHSNRSLTFSTLRVNPSLRFDCSTLSDASVLPFVREMFEANTSTTLLPKKQATMPYEERSTGQMCDVYLVEVTDLPPLVLKGSFGDAGKIDLDIDQAGDGTLRWRSPEVGTARYHALSPLPTPTAECVLPDDRLGRWSGPLPPGSYDVTVTRVVDGCLELALTATRTWSLCIPGEAWPFADTATLTIATNDEVGFHTVTLQSPEATLFVARGVAVPPLMLPRATLVRGECEGALDACQTVSQNGSLLFDAGEVPAGGHLVSGAQEIWVTQAAHRPIVDPTCDYGLDLGSSDDLGFVIVTRPSE